MNQTTSGCGNCYYYFNGQCTKADKCTGNTVNRTISINETYNPTIGINESVTVKIEDYKLCTNCLLCGKTVAISVWQSGLAICDECKQAIAWIKEKMKEKGDETIRSL